MILYGSNYEKVSIFEPILNILISSSLILVSVIFIFLGYTFNVYPLLIFILSILWSHLSDTLVKICMILPTPQYKLVNISYYTGLLTFSLWNVGSYILTINIITNFCSPVLFWSCLATFIYVVTLYTYFAAFFGVPNSYFYPPSGYQYR